MTRLMLNTDVIGDLFWEHPDVLTGFRRHAPQDPGIGPLSVMDIESCLERQPQARQGFGEPGEDLRADLGLLSFEAPGARHSAQTRAALAAASPRRPTTPPGLPECLT